MLVFALLILLILLLWSRVNSMSEGGAKELTEKKYLKITCGVLVFLAAIRGSTVGPDTIGYISDYIFVRTSTFEQVLERYDVGSGYYWLSKLFSLSGLSVQWWFGMVEVLFMYAIYQFAIRFAKDKMLFLLCIVTMGLYTFSLAGLKQTTGMAFAILAYSYFTDKRYVLMVIFAGLAFWCHHATGIMAAAFVLYTIRNINKYNLLVLPVICVSIFFGSTIWSSLILVLEDEHYMMYLDADNIYSSATIIFYISVYVLSLVPYKNYMKTDKQDARVLYSLSLIVIVFQSLVTSFSSAFRIAYCFLPYMGLLISNNVQYLSNRKKQMLTLIFICFISIWVLYTNRELTYTFFWNN